MKSKPSARAAAFRFLTYRSLSEKELTDKLRRKEYSEGDIRETLSYLKELGYVNDRELAEEVFRFYKDQGIYGMRYIRRKMELRGLSAEDFSLSREEEYQRASSLMARQEALRPGFSRNLRRAAAFLERRGYSLSVIAAMVEDLRSASGEDFE